MLMSHDAEVEVAPPSSTPVDMRSTCAHADDMSKMIQIRNVPDSLHRELKSRAALAGMSLSDYLTEQLSRLTGMPTRKEFLRRLREDPPTDLDISAAEIIREMRGPLP